ncbi:MAG: glycine cleavage system protein GcvH [Thermoplasmata archaeon]|nr:glycine cleavage system protein GcvH [Thermoplasmata archaeon]
MTDARPPENLRYTKSHEWVLAAGDEVTVGITDHAQQELTDIVFVDLPKLGKNLAAGEVALVLESVKTVADVYAPFSGEIVAVNENLRAHPELVNRSPYAEGWLFRLRRTAVGETDSTIEPVAYAALTSTPERAH